MPVSACAPVPFTLGVVTFNFAEFTGLFPEFAGLTSQQAQTAFNFATLQLDNSCCSRVQNANVRLSLLYMLTAHLLFLSNGSNDGAGNIVPPPGIVGHIDSATEGSVSVAASLSSNVGQSQAYYAQTKYGIQYWQATAQFRTALYLAPPCDPANPLWVGVGGPGVVVGPDCGCG